MSKVMHQMSAKAERAGVARGEALRDPVSDETQGTTHETEGTGPELLLKALTRQNLLKAMKRVKANKGAAGVDGMDIGQTVEYLKHHWPRIRSELLAGTYRPSPVRRVAIPKPGGGERELGIPTVVDRLIQQALLQVLQPLIDPTFSEHSHGFRPARRAHDAVLAAQSFVQSGKKVVVDVDLEKFFDRVNASKSAVASAYGRKFLGYSFWAAKGKVVKLRVADKAQKAYKQRVRQLTRRMGGKGMAEVALKLKQYVNGWKAYFKLADTPRVWRELDEWMRHRLRAIQLKQWKRGRTMYRELTKLGAPQGVAERVAGNSRCWWRNSNGLIKTVLTIQYFDKLGAPRLV